MISFLRNLFSSKKKRLQAFAFRDLYDKIGYYPMYSEENYIRALTHSSSTKKLEEKNERLEFLGDAVISFAVAENLFHKLNGMNEGTLTKARATIVNRKNLNKVGIEIGIGKYLKHKLSERQLEEAPDIIGNAFEALIGAYFLEYGMRETEALVGKLLMDGFDTENFHKNISDPKSYLIEWMQAKKKTFSFEHHNASAENGTFSVSLKIDGEVKAKGVGKNKKEAEQDACLNAIKILELE